MNGRRFYESMMIDWISLGILFAQGEAGKGNAPGLSDFIYSILPPLAIMLLVYQFLVARPQRREQAARDAMLGAMKKNDKVLTIAGIFGTVANVSSDGLEVTLKVDDNTRIRMTRSSIQRVLSAEGDSDKPADAKST